MWRGSGRNRTVVVARKKVFPAVLPVAETSYWKEVQLVT